MCMFVNRWLDFQDNFILQEKYGFDVVEVRDNGSGIEEKDMKFIAKPHFTSKIESFADLGE